MLVNLHVKNLALIEETDIDFTSHLNILTGETGAGKSILIGSIQSALGAKIPKDMIRHGCDSALIELIFHTESEMVKALMEKYEIPFEDGEIIISRRITNNRVINKINDCSITIARLKELSPFLLDLSGQHENQLLLNPQNHLKMLDNFGKDKIVSQKAKVAEDFHKYQEIQKELKQKNIGEEERIREMEFLKFEIQEIEQAALKAGEDEELEQLYTRISHAKDILSVCSSIHDLTSNNSISVESMLGKAIRSFSDVIHFDERIGELSEQLSTVDDLLNDFNRELSDYISSMEFDPEIFAETEERLDTINRLKAKYGDSIDKIHSYMEKSRERFETLSNLDEIISSSKSKSNTIKKKLDEDSQKLTKLRKEAALPMAEAIRQALFDLNFNDVRFEISFKELEQSSADGKDQVCFMISTNPGMEVRPLHEIASGGELSRIMLAIKSVLADQEQIETLIFDEIDTGISGRTAQKVSERLSEIARERQVIAITHLPQIAAMADSHFLIEKTSDDKSTISNIHRLSDEESVEELARMLGGAEITSTVLENAREMKALAADFSNKH